MRDLKVIAVCVDNNNMKRSRRARASSDEGVSMVEMAIVSPLLVLLLFGIIEAGWAFSQQLEVRHGVREGARVAALNEGTLDEIVDATCVQMGLAVSNAAISVTKTGTAVGNTVRVQVVAPVDSITGLASLVFGGATLTEAVEMRIERIPTWADGTRPCP